jgi:hypothetical protein
VSEHRPARKILILGGAGMVGIQVAREAARELGPEQIIISSLTAPEVDETIELLRGEAREFGWKTEFTPAPGDIFIPESLQGKVRADLCKDRKLFDALFDDIFSPDREAYRGSALYALISKFRPDVIVDCINTATAISYQDAFTTSRKVKLYLDRLEEKGELEKPQLSQFVESVRELLIAQGVPQITRHILFLNQALKDSDVRVYIKVGTTGTGGMGINIPYTHSEDKPSATLLSKSAIGFAHTGLLFLLARTPGAVKGDEASHGTMIKEVKPGAMIGFKRLGVTHVRLNGPSGRREPGYLWASREESLSDSVQPRQSFDEYGRYEGGDHAVKMIGADTGENGFFSIGEFEAITYPRQMEYVTPEEVARTVILEIVGSSTGRDVISAIDGAITEPSYRAGVLRDYALAEMDRLEKHLAGSDEVVPSVAVGHLGPPRLSKLLIEAYLLRAALGTSVIDELAKISPEKMLEAVEAHLQKNPKTVSLITTIGIPLLREKGGKFSLTRGPRLNIPVPRPDGAALAIDRDGVEKYAQAGWVDLRVDNFREWQERIASIVKARPNIVEFGSAAFELSNYLPREFTPGDVVGWLFCNEVDDQGMVGHRIL